jgi:hypothetical protein
MVMASAVAARCPLAARCPVLAALAVVATAAAAPSFAAAADTPEALIKRGVQLRKAGDDPGALIELQKAYQLAPTPRAAAQLGLVEQALGKWDDAELHLAESIRSSGDSWIEKNRATLETSLGVVRSHVGSLEVTGDPAGAEVFVNGRKVGELPLAKPLRVIAGDVDVELRASGYESKAQKVTVDAYQFKSVVLRLGRSEAAGAAAGGKGEGGGAAVAAGGREADAAVEKQTERVEPAPPAAGKRSVRPLVGWVVAGAGAATTVVGLVAALAGHSKMEQAVDDAERANITGDMALYASASDKFADGRSQRTLGRVLLVVGGVVAVGGAVLALTAPRAEAPRAAVARPPRGGAGAVAPWLTASAGGGLDAAGLSLSGRW